MRHKSSSPDPFDAPFPAKRWPGPRQRLIGSRPAQVAKHPLEFRPLTGRVPSRRNRGNSELFRPALAVPVGATTGPVCITTSVGTVCSAFNFTVPPPVLTNFVPKHGAVGKTVTIIGKYFTGATSVTFNGTPAAFTISSNAVIRVTVPMGATAGPISVTTPYGTATSSANFAIP